MFHLLACSFESINLCLLTCINVGTLSVVYSIMEKILPLINPRVQGGHSTVAAGRFIRLKQDAPSTTLSKIIFKTSRGLTHWFKLGYRNE